LVVSEVFIAWLLGGVVWFGTLAVDPPTGPHGSVNLEVCEFRGRTNDSAHCTGTFRSDDGTVAVTDVRIHLKAHRDALDYTESVPARLREPTEAFPDSSVLSHRVFHAIFAVGLLGWAVAQTVWLVRYLRREADREVRRRATR
jgi:hypothetical protein